MLDWLDLELEQLIRNILRGWLHTDPSTHRIFNIPGGYLLGMLSVIPRYPPALPPSAKDSAPDHGIWVTIFGAYGSGDQRAATDVYSWPEINLLCRPKVAKKAEYGPARAVRLRSHKLFPIIMFDSLLSSIPNTEYYVCFCTFVESAISGIN